MLNKKKLRELSKKARIRSHGYTCCAEIRDNGGEKLLTVNIFLDRNLIYTVFMEKESFLTLNHKNSKWMTSSLDSFYFDGAHCAVFLSRNNVLAIYDLLHEWGLFWEEKPIPMDLDPVIYYQRKIQRERQAQKAAKKQKECDEENALMPPLPDDYASFVKDKVMKDDNYIFYENKKKKARCTYCDISFPIIKAKKGEMATCPHCGNDFKLISAGLGRKHLEVVRWSVLLTVLPDGRCATRYIRHIKNFDASPDITSIEMYRSFYGKKMGDYQYDFMRWIPWNGRVRGSNFYNPSIYLCPYKATIYQEENLNQIVTGSVLQYVNFTELLQVKRGSRNDDRTFELDYIIFKMLNFPWIEKFIKIHESNLVRDFMVYNNAQIKALFNSRAESPWQICRVTKPEFMFLKSKGLNFNNLETCQKARSILERPLRPEDADFFDFVKKHWWQIDDITKCVKKSSKLFKYLMSLDDLVIYKDYLNWSKDLGYDMNDPYVIFPENLNRRHDEREIEYEEAHFPEKAAYRRQVNELLEGMRKKIKNEKGILMTSDGLLIRLPYSAEEIKKEGQKLHHCVATYMEKVATGATTILFVRKTSEPEIPYYTLEWKKDHIQQCRGNHNSGMTPEVEVFTKQFAEQMYRKSLLFASAG